MATRPRRTTPSLGWMLLVAALHGGCGSDTPSNPTPPPTTTGLRISGVTALTSLSQSSQLTATAVLSDNNTQIVTSLTTWSSRNPGVATVSSAGLLTSVAFGTTQVDATYQNQVTTADVRIAPGDTFILSGTITDSATMLLIDGALVEVAGGGAFGPRSTTSVAGSYSLVGLSGEITMTVTKTGYRTKDQAVTMSEDRVVNFSLQPTPTSSRAVPAN